MHQVKVHEMGELKMLKATVLCYLAAFLMATLTVHMVDYAVSTEFVKVRTTLHVTAATWRR